MQLSDWLSLFAVIGIILFIVWTARMARRDRIRSAQLLIEQAEERARLLQLDKQRKEQAEKQEKERQIAEYDAILVRHRDVVDKFCEIAERKVSVLDEYGDENWDVLPEEIDKCLHKIARLEPIDLSRWSAKDRMVKRVPKLLDLYRDACAIHLAKRLNDVFHVHHQGRKNLPVTDFSMLAGVDFETCVAGLLKKAGFESVAGTPATGDQGADLIAKKDGRTIAIQAKGYQGPVGNGAVQEIVGALKYYRADEGWVVTNSTFTQAARALAQANNIRLIDGAELKRGITA